MAKNIQLHIRIAAQQIDSIRSVDKERIVRRSPEAAAMMKNLDKAQGLVEMYDALLEQASRNYADALQGADLRSPLAAPHSGMGTESEAASVRYSKKVLDDGRQYVEANRQVITGDNPKQWRDQIENYINNEIRHGNDVTVYANDGTPLTITEDTAGKARFRNEVRRPDGTTRLMTDEEYAVKLRAEGHIDELAETSFGGNTIVPDAKNHPFAKDGFVYRTAYFKDATGYYRLTISVGKNGEVSTVYNIGKIKEADFPVQSTDERRTDSEGSKAGETTSDNSIPEKGENSKRQFSLKEPIEEANGLIAVHNLNEAKLRGALELGGLPMPSIAITKEQGGIEGYGDITFVFSKGSIDPADRRNRVYGADAWTPTQPDIGYKINEKIAGDVYGRVRNIINSNEFTKGKESVPLDTSNIDDFIQRGRGDPVEAYEQNRQMRLAYALENIDGFRVAANEKGDYDRYETYDRVDEAIDQEKYRQWLAELFDGIVEKKGIRNNRDFFTPMGDRRKFEQLYYEYNLENLVRAMAGEPESGNSIFGGIGPLAGAAATKLNTIKDIKNNSGRLMRLSGEELDARKGEWEQRLSDITKRMLEGQNRSNSFIALSDAAEVVVDIVRKTRTSQGIEKALQEWKNAYTVNAEIARDITDLVNELAEMPVHYFEAKPRRAVGFDEVKAAIFPEGKHPDLEDALRKKGVDVLTCTPGDNESRLAAMNEESVAKQRFSLKDTMQPEYDELLAENKQLKASLGSALETIKAQNMKVTDKRAVNALAKKITNEYGSKYGAQKLADNLQSIFDTIANAEDTTTAEGAMEVLRSVTRAVVEQGTDVNTELREEYAPLLKQLRTSPIRLTATQKAEAAAMYGDYNTFRKKFSGRSASVRRALPLI